MERSIKQRRLSANMTQAETVKILNEIGIECDVSLLSRIENGVVEKAELIENALVDLYASKTTRAKETATETNSGSLQIDKLLSLIPTGQANAISRKKLVELMGMTDRKVRNLIKVARRHEPILNLQCGDGYFRPEAKEKPLVDKWIKQETARAKTTFWAMRGARNFLKNNM